jgi:hypothetical protein
VAPEFRCVGEAMITTYVARACVIVFGNALFVSTQNPHDINPAQKFLTFSFFLQRTGFFRG